MTSLPEQSIDRDARFTALIRVRHAEAELAVRVCFGIALLIVFSTKAPFSTKALAQFDSSGITYAPNGSPIDIPQTNLVPIAPRSSGASPYASPPAYDNSGLSTIAPSLGPPSSGIPGATASGSLFDPYSSGQAPGYYQPAMPPGTFAPVSSGLTSPMTGAPPMYGAPPQMYGTPPQMYGTPPPTYGTPPPLYGMEPVPSTYAVPGAFGAPAFPSTIYPSGTPSTLFPSGLYGNSPFDSSSGFNAYQLLQGPRFRYTFLSGGGSPDALGINDFDVSIALSFPNFLYSAQPLYVVPSFSLHLWDGPDSSTGADLPPNAYSGFLDFGWQTDPNQMFGAEFGVRVGAFTDFDTFDSDSLRIMGKGLGSFRLTPWSTLKLGVYYLDRNNWKLVPAFGVLCQANPNTRLDIFFPQPKFAHYCRTIGTQDLWWYLAGDYGGGSWTIQRANGSSDSVDINDLRVMVGWEWGRSELIRAGRRSAFFELGYVFDREIRYRNNPSDDINNNDAFMLRAGIGY